MRRSVRYLLVLTLLVGLISFAVPGQTSENANTEVYWKIVGCWISLIAHEPVDLGTVSNFSPEDVLKDEGNNVEVKSNCYPYIVNVEATRFELPLAHLLPPHTAIEDFGIRGGDLTTYEIFDGLGAFNSKEIAKANFSGKTELYMDYRYVLDIRDVSGDYAVYLTYTVSTE